MAQCPQPIFVKKTRIHVPCGKCAACRARKANEWIIRLQQEEKHSRSVYFVTLTYTEDSIPRLSDGRHTLKKSDLQDFINLLRQYAPFRYYGIGEYGDKGERPHYHIIIFDFHPIVNPETGNIVYHKNWSNITTNMLISNVDTEAVIYKAWKKGIVQVQPLEGGAIRYVASYTVDLSVRSDSTEQQKIFALMSKRPPIGYQYYNNMEVRNYHRKGTIEQRVKKVSFRSEMGETALPRLYREKIYSKIERQVYAQSVIDRQLKELRKVKNYKKYSKNLYEAQEHKNDISNQRNKLRSI